mmetsp:Transcript_56900/g.123111  ORF Transcript_56900/g.123111 Transcript_56900/m.123111 type:complete len:232 (-) Transcript_56900:258-953(-)
MAMLAKALPRDWYARMRSSVQTQAPGNLGASTSSGPRVREEVAKPVVQPREQRRLNTELQELRSLPEDYGVSADTVDGDMSHWRGYVSGPAGTPYFGGLYTVDLNIPVDYPFKPPKVRFVTRIWHPNVSSQTGAICLDILDKEWSPALTIRTALLSVQALLAAPEPDDPQDAEVARMFKRTPKLFLQTAKHWTETFALDPRFSAEDIPDEPTATLPYRQSSCRATAQCSWR